MEIRTIDGRRATDRAGAAELLGVSEQTVALRASPKQRPTSGFPEAIGTEDRRDWYALDDLEAHLLVLREQRHAAPNRAPVWLRDGPRDELLPATTFRAAAGIGQGTWKRYVQSSRPAWERGEDGYLPRPDDEEDYRGTGNVYYWTRHRMIHWLDHRTGERMPGVVGRKPGPRPGVADAVAAIQAADGQMTGTTLATQLGVSLKRAYDLLRLAREQMATAPK
jgi:hypothetical protein